MKILYTVADRITISSSHLLRKKYHTPILYYCIQKETELFNYRANQQRERAAATERT
jgi:hypothetical protein